MKKSIIFLPATNNFGLHEYTPYLYATKAGHPHTTLGMSDLGPKWTRLVPNGITEI